MNLDGPRQYTWRVTADLVVSRTRGAALFQSQANLISVALLDCNNWGANWRAEWRSYHPLFMCWVFFQGLCKGVLRFSINYRSVKSQKKQLEAALLKRDSGGTDQDTQQNNNSTTLSEPGGIPKRGFEQINIYSYTIILTRIIHTYHPTDQYVNILYIHDISPLFCQTFQVPLSILWPVLYWNWKPFVFFVLLVWRYMVLLFYSIYVSGVAQKIEGRLKALKGVRIFNMLLGSAREKFGKPQDMVVLIETLLAPKR